MTLTPTYIERNGRRKLIAAPGGIIARYDRRRCVKPLGECIVAESCDRRDGIDRRAI